MNPVLRRKARILGFRIIFQREKIGICLDGEKILYQKTGLPDADIDFAKTLVNQFESEKKHIDRLIQKSLTSSWKQHRLQSRLNALLRTGCAELLCLGEQNQKIVINEMLEIARMYCGESCIKICNGILDKIWKIINEKKSLQSKLPVQNQIKIPM